jgi:GTP-binding protein HflX
MIEQKDLGFEQAILIGIINKNQPEERIQEYLDELAFLTHTAGGTVAKRFTQRMETPHPQNLYRIGENGRGTGLCQDA